MNKVLLGTLFALFCVSSSADDLKIADDFKAGDLVSADTFNQIFDTIEKINRTVIDTDLVGVWSCNAMTSRNTTGWTSKGLFYILENAQVNLTASSASTSLESPYSISTSSPSPFKRTISSAFSGTYVLYNNKLFTKLTDETEARIWDVNIISPTRFELTFLETSAQSFPTAYASFITCDSAAAVPAAPTNPTISQDGPNKTVTISWTDMSSDETGFKVYRKLSSETEFSLLGNSTASSYDDSTVTEGTTAYYQVVSFNDNGESARSKTVSITTDYTAPTIASVSPENNSSLTISDAIEILGEYRLSPTISFSESVSVASNYVEVKNIATSSSVDTIPFLFGNQALGSYNYSDLVNTASFYVAYASGVQYQITIKKEAIKDGAGNTLAEDFVWTVTME